MKKGFVKNVVDALKAVSYSDSEDNSRFLAAVQDLSIDNPAEGRLFLRNADDRFIEICSSVMGSEFTDINTVINQASTYLQEEYWINPDQAEDMATATTNAFWEYKNGESIEGPNEPDGGLDERERQYQEYLSLRVHKHEDQHIYDEPDEVHTDEPDVVPTDESKKRIISRLALTAKTKWLLIAAGIALIVVLGIVALVSGNGSSKDAKTVETTEATEQTTSEVVENPEIRYDADALVEGSEVVFTVYGASDNNAVEWSSDNPDVLSFSTVDTGKAEAKKAGIANVTAEFDGKKLEEKIGVLLATPNTIKVDSDEVTVDGEKEIVVSYTREADYTWSTVGNSDLLEAEWTEDWYGNSTYLKLTALGEGTTTLTLWAGDENENRDESVEPIEITVHCYTD